MLKKRQNTLETCGEDAKLHSKRVEKMLNHTRNEWRRCQTTLRTSGEDVSGTPCLILMAHWLSWRDLSWSEEVNYTRFGWRRCKTHSFRLENMQNTLVSSGEDVKHTRFEWRRCKTHSFRVYYFFRRVEVGADVPRGGVFGWGQAQCFSPRQLTSWRLQSGWIFWKKNFFKNIFFSPQLETTVLRLLKHLNWNITHL